LSIRTVERHIANIYAKTGAHGRAHATVYALRHGLISDRCANEPTSFPPLVLTTDT
jgi:hypothetical protein